MCLAWTPVPRWHRSHRWARQGSWTDFPWTGAHVPFSDLVSIWKRGKEVALFSPNEYIIRALPHALGKAQLLLGVRKGVHLTVFLFSLPKDCFLGTIYISLPCTSLSSKIRLHFLHVPWERTSKMLTDIR